MTEPPVDLVDEYALGRLIRVEAVSGGGPQVRRMITDAGSFLVKPAYRAFEWDLYATVETTLNHRSVRQARLMRTTTGATVSSTGHVVQEWLPGSMSLNPSAEQVVNIFGHQARYTAELATVTVPTELTTTRTIFTQVAEATWLTQHLQRLCQQLPPTWDRDLVQSAQARLGELVDLPDQLVHGDIGPDNVLYDGGRVVAIIDFTPFNAPALFGLCTALYWFFVHGRREPDLAGIRSAVAVYDTVNNLSSEERATLPAMLIKESLRRLATPLALAERDGTSVPIESTHLRHQAVVALSPAYGDLQRVLSLSKDAS